MTNEARVGRMKSRQQRSTRQRRGVSILELIVTSVLFGTVTASLGPALVWVRQQRDLSEQQQLAAVELANLAERAALRPVDEITTETLSQVSLSAAAQAALDEPQLRVSVEDEPGSPPARRILWELSWKDSAGRDVAPVRLVTWRHSASSN